MTFEEMEHGLKGLQDNMTVQGVMMHRLENNLDRLEGNLDRLEAVVAQNSEAIARNTEAIHHLADGQASMQSAMHSLFEQIDRFIRGLGSDGHKRKGKA